MQQDAAASKQMPYVTSTIMFVISSHRSVDSAHCSEQLQCRPNSYHLLFIIHMLHIYRILMPHFNAGVCGDPFEGGTGPGFWANKPFNEYNINLPRYAAGSRITLNVELSANHGGKFGFAICDRTSNLDQACFDRFPLTRADLPGERWFWMPNGECSICLETCFSGYRAAFVTALGFHNRACSELPNLQSASPLQADNSYNCAACL